MKLAVAIVLALAAPASADPEPSSGAFAEVNLAPFVFHGYSAFAGYHRGHFHVGAGTYAFKLPDFIRDAGFDNASGLTIHSELGLGVFGRYFVRPDGTGVYGALQLGWERFGITDDAQPGMSSHVYETYANPYVGYLWKPLRGKGLYVNPNAGVAFQLTTSGTFELGNRSYAFKGFVPLVFFQVGYELD